MRDRSAPLKAEDVGNLDWGKMQGLLPAVVQDAGSGRVLMLGYVNEEALAATLRSGRATFFSRSKGRLWEKGESSGNHLRVQSIHADCDKDALLVLAHAQGPTCHTGSTSCFGDGSIEGPAWLAELGRLVRQRANSGETSSYTYRLLSEGPARIAQKVGEEGVEVALAAVSRPAGECAEELADLLYHVTVLLESLGLDWNDVVDVLKARHESARNSTASS